MTARPTDDIAPPRDGAWTLALPRSGALGWGDAEALRAGPERACVWEPAMRTLEEREVVG